MDAAVSPIRQRLEAVRDCMARAGVQALLVPSADPHLSEYLPERWQARQWLSGFTGSMGTLVVTPHKAALFADSRYWEQAERELAGSSIALEKIPTGASTQHMAWLARELPRGGTVLADGSVLSLAAAQLLQATLDQAGVRLRTDADLFDQAWQPRPALPAATVYAQPAAQAGEPRAQRLARVRQAMAQHGATHHFVSTVDDVAWLTALRGADVDYNPVFLAHLLLDATRATLFVGAGKVPPALAAALAADGVALADYAGAAAALQALPAGSRLLLDPKRVTLGFRQQVPAGVPVVEAINPSTLFKSRKSDADAAHIRQAMVQDGIAMCEFYARFEAALARGEALTELTVDEWLSAERARRPGFVGLSFSTIAGFQANGALPHYRATPEHHAALAGNGLLLIDSGGQYHGGTTDITRVWPIGEVSDSVKRDVTLVLKGTMALSRARFPRGTPGPMLDALARAPLWEQGLDYGHGTGHGVGYFLNVHEGPQSISKTTPDAHMGMEPGMVTSVEPGLYRSGQHGVRIENLVLAVPAATPENGAFGEMLAFETLTLCPIDTRTLLPALLREDERAWLNAYHATVRERLAPHLAGPALAWLQQRCQAL